MQENGVRRLPVIDGDKVIGMLSLGDLARADKDELAGNTVERLISSPPNN
jgi:CBS domain-containing protein